VDSYPAGGLDSPPSLIHGEKMLFEFLAGAALVGAILLVIGFMGNERRLFLIAAGGIVFVLAGLFAAMDTTGLEVQTYGGCMNESAESSYVWDGYCNVSGLFPEEQLLCSKSADIVDGVFVSGGISDTCTENDVYHVVEENGTHFNITYWFLNTGSTYPDKLYFNGRYDAPAPQREFIIIAYNWTSGAWDSLGGPYKGSGGTDISVEIACPDFSDYINATNDYIQIKLVMKGSVTPGVYSMYVDWLELSGATGRYVESIQLINCTRDQYNTTYTYGPCYTEKVGFNYTQGIALMLILTGIGFLLGTVQWARQK